LLALRYRYGNDYVAYLQGFLDINRYTMIDYFNVSSHFEIGWIFLCRVFRPFGFFAMVAVLAAFNCWVYYRFIKRYVSPRYYWFAVFLYVFTPGFMLIHASAMRQSLAIDIFIFSIDYIYKKDFLRYLACIVLASSFHSSALILLPIYLLRLFNFKINILTAVSLFSLFLFMLGFSSLFLPYIIKYTGIFFEKYQNYKMSSVLGSGLGVAFSAFLFALILFYERLQIADVALLFRISMLGYFIIPLSLSIMMISRIGMYFQPITIVVFPILFLKIKNPIYKNIILAMLIFMTMYLYFQFFQSSVWKIAFGRYQTIFSAPEIY